MVTSPGHVKSGLSVSIIVTVKLHSEVFPAASVAIKVFTVVPTGNNDPLAKPAVCSKNTIGNAQLSVTTGSAYVTTAPHSPSSFTKEISAGQIITGSSSSTTFTSKQQDDTNIPFASSVTV